ncbi:hypothetical protein FGB62_145g04 [Gracilaria domingensis]|nr:hypothetical protein FGB62_145g04 [Gracilaria domingensis]
MLAPPRSKSDPGKIGKQNKPQGTKKPISGRTSMGAQTITNKAKEGPRIRLAPLHPSRSEIPSYIWSAVPLPGVPNINAEDGVPADQEDAIDDNHIVFAGSKVVPTAEDFIAMQVNPHEMNMGLAFANQPADRIRLPPLHPSRSEIAFYIWSAYPLPAVPKTILDGDEYSSYFTGHQDASGTHQSQMNVTPRQPYQHYAKRYAKRSGH